MTTMMRGLGIGSVCLLLGLATHARAEACASDEDCPACSVCVNGACMGTGVVECATDGDCGEGEICQVVAGEPCKNHCISAECLVVFCAEECDPYGQPCAEGQTCVQAIKGCCGVCEASGSECLSDADCGPCDACVEGACLALPIAPECVDDADCQEGFTCQANDAAPCQNRCVDKTCWVVDCMQECDPFSDTCGAGEVCVEPIVGCCGVCQATEPACVQDSDCGPCAACFDGLCVGLGDVSCTSDADCGAGETCQVHPANPCLNACVPVEPLPCVASDECGPCQACVDGVCMGTGVLACLSDFDCGEGGVCVKGDDPCQNHCEYGGIPCADDADCGACSVCVDGTCMGTGAVMCEAHADCGADEYCHQDLLDPCKNQCQTLPEGACRGQADCGPGEGCVMLPDGSGLGDCVAATCADDADCGPCAACVNGACKGLGAILCETDEDCGAGERCEVVPEAPCQNACVAVEVEDEPDTVDEDAYPGGECVGDPDVSGSADSLDGADTRDTPPGGGAEGGDCSVAGMGASAGAGPAWLALLSLVALARRRRY